MKLHYCFLERFNNYFNRKIIKYDSLLEYQNNSKSFFIPEDTHGAMMPFDFNPNDNVMTEIIANEVPFDPDYFLLLNDDSSIVQRWFVLEQKRNRQGQWLYSLRRDVIADNLNELLESPIFVQKGMLEEDDPFIINDEGCNFNKIKKSEELLKDETDSAWIIAYIAKNKGGSNVNVQADSEKITIPVYTLNDLASTSGINASTLADLINTDSLENNAMRVTYNVEIQIQSTGESAGTVNRLNLQFDSQLNYVDYTTEPSEETGILFRRYEAYDRRKLQDAFINAVLTYKAQLLAQIPSIVYRNYYINPSQLNLLKQYEGKYIKYNGIIYKLNIREKEISAVTRAYFGYGDYSSLKNIADQTVVNYGANIAIYNTPQYYSFSTWDKRVYLMLEEVSNDELIPQLNLQISSGRKTTIDQECDILAIPYGNIKFMHSGTAVGEQASKENSMRIASAIALELDASCYDVQLLPYCPVDLKRREDIIPARPVDFSDMVEGVDFEYIYKNISNTELASTESSDAVITPDGDGYLVTFTIDLDGEIPVDAHDLVVEKIEFSSSLHPEYTDLQWSASGQIITVTYKIDTYTTVALGIDVYYHYSASDIPTSFMLYIASGTFSKYISKELTTSESKKIVSNCDMYRLVSPNYQGAFEFNLAKNNNHVSGFNVFCTYKPYTPTIKVAPDFNWLYGIEFQDNRGLLCAGDFSLPRISSAWTSYQLNNKNYQNIFNREIQHLDFVNKYQMRDQLVSGAVGIATDTAKGAGAGAYVGGGWGALAGATVGSLTSATGYVIDTDTLAKTQRENKQLAIDKYNYQLGNITALPYTMTKIGSFDAISKYFPFLEFYTCTDKEKKAFENKIKYESMTVMRIGTISEFKTNTPHYFKGELIRNDEIADDSHILNAIYEELLKGVYI